MLPDRSVTHVPGLYPDRCVATSSAEAFRTPGEVVVTEQFLRRAA